MRLSIPLLALSLSGCTFYLGGADDSPPVDDVPDDDGWPSVDAGPVVDAPWPNCTWPSGTNVTICGSVRDVATSGVLPDPYQIEVQYYDALDLANDPTAAVRLYPVSTFLGYLGDFADLDVPLPPSGILAIVVDDSPTTGLDRYRRTVTSMQVSAGSFVEFAVAHVLRADTDLQWTQEIGLTAPPTIVDDGAILQCFEAGPAQPATGVSATEAGAPDADDTIYFSDSGQQTRQQLNPILTATGANGCVIDRASALVEHSGVSGAPGDCWWESKLAAAVPKTLWVSFHGAICPI